MTKSALGAVLLSAALTLTACGGGDEAGGSDKGYNDADVAFASDMIQHHAQALSMVDLTMGRRLDPAVAKLTEDIRAAQAPEIETMTDWLQEWDQPVPETVRDHANAHGDGGHADSDTPGMMSTEDMEALEHADDDKFQDEWLEAMVAHHEGAVEMAEAQQEDGQNRQAIALAKDIEAAQEAEIAEMRELLER